MFPDYLSASYDYGQMYHCQSTTKYMIYLEKVTCKKKEKQNTNKILAVGSVCRRCREKLGIIFREIGELTARGLQKRGLPTGGTHSSSAAIKPIIATVESLSKRLSERFVFL